MLDPVFATPPGACSVRLGHQGAVFYPREDVTHPPRHRARPQLDGLRELRAWIFRYKVDRLRPVSRSTSGSLIRRWPANVAVIFLLRGACLLVIVVARVSKLTAKKVEMPLRAGLVPSEAAIPALHRYGKTDSGNVKLAPTLKVRIGKETQLGRIIAISGTIITV